MWKFKILEIMTFYTPGIEPRDYFYEDIQVFENLNEKYEAGMLAFL